MSGIDETIVREYFELNGFLVRQLRKYQVQSRNKRTDEEIDLIVYNPAWKPSSRKPDFMLFASELPLLQRAVVFVKPWHSQRFSPGTLRGSADFSKFLENDVLKSAEQLFSVSDESIGGLSDTAAVADAADANAAIDSTGANATHPATGAAATAAATDAAGGADANATAPNTDANSANTGETDLATGTDPADTAFPAAQNTAAPLAKILVLPGLPTHEPHKSESIRLLQNAGLDAIISFRSMLQDLLGKVEVNHNYSKSDFLQTLRLLKNYDMVKSPQMELFGKGGK